MKNIIRVLEQIGQDAALQHQQAQAEFIEQADLNEELQAALIIKDAVLLEQQLNVRTEIVCFISRPEDDEQNASHIIDDESKQIQAIVNA